MAFTQPIPQDIIDDIVEQLHGDKDTLLICSLVSRSFQSSCRKHLFSYVELDRPYIAHRFHALLVNKPRLAVLIRHLRISPDPNGGIIQSPWFKSSTDLPPVLDMLVCLRRLEFGQGSCMLVVWGELSRELQSALLAICQSPSLSSLDINHVVSLPRALLTNTQAKKLSVRHASIHDYSTPVTELGSMWLEALDLFIAPEALNSGFQMSSPDLFPNAANLRQLSIRTTSSPQYTMEVAHSVMKTASKSLRQFIWQSYQRKERDLSPHFTLATLSNLRSLSFSIHYKSEEDLISAVELLRDPAVSRNLEELTFAFDFLGISMDWRVPMMVVVRFVGWEKLEAVLGTRVGADSPLHTVNVYVDPGCPDADADSQQLQSQLEERLSLLVARNVRVSAKFCRYWSVDLRGEW